MHNEHCAFTDLLYGDVGEIDGYAGRSATVVQC